ncbi:MAG: HlyD family secretion protein [Paracoccaceae bacterium]|jgi:HlyD family secretion protein
MTPFVKVVVLLGCAVWPVSGVLSQEPVRAPLPNVQVTPVTQTAIKSTAFVSGTLVARQEVLIHSRVSGPEITALLVDVGDKVTAQQVLARLNDATLSMQLEQANANLAAARAGVAQANGALVSARVSATQAGLDLERSRILRNRGDVAQATLDQATAKARSADATVGSAVAGTLLAKAQVAQAQAALDLAGLNLSWTQIVTPVAGTVLSRDAQLGGLSGDAGQPLFRIIADSLVELEAGVVESDLARLTIGDPAVVQITGFAPLEGRVRLISPFVDPQTRLGSVRISFENPGDTRTGLFARAVVVTDAYEALTVPASAIQSIGSQAFTKLVVDGRVEQRALRTGILSDGRREVLGGVAQGDQVIARAGEFFRDGDLVNPVPLRVPSSVAE